MNLTKSADVQLMALMGLDGAKLGMVREIFVDLATGQTAFLIVESAGFMGGSGKFHPVPWSVVRHDPIAAGFQAQLSKDQLKSSPSYDRAQLANSDYGWDEQSTKYFTAALAPAAP